MAPNVRQGLLPRPHQRHRGKCLNQPGTFANPTDDTKARSFDAKVQTSCLRQAIQSLTLADNSRVYDPSDACTKTGKPVLEVLREKHLAMRDCDLSGPSSPAFENYDATPTNSPHHSPEMVEAIAPCLSGSASPSGIDATTLPIGYFVLDPPWPLSAPS